MRLQFLPRHIEALRADQGEHVSLLAILPYEGGGEAEATNSLDASGGPEDGSGQ